MEEGTINMTELTMELLEERYNKATGIEKEILADMTDQADAEDAMAYLEDVTNHGCGSGIVGGLIYYDQTRAFFTKHADEIFALLHEYEIDEQVRHYDSFTDFSNKLAWLGYELVAHTLYQELNEAYPN